MPITPQQAKAELARRELAKRGISLEQPSQILPEQITQSPDVQLMAEWLRNMPFGKRISSLMSGQPLENIEQTLSAIPEPQSKTFGMAVGKALPDIAMATPFMRGAGLIPKIPAFAKTALGLGTYAGTKAAAQKRPILPSAGMGALAGAGFHGASRLGATLIPSFIPGAERIGSALGGYATGKILSPQEDKEALFYGAMGGMFPSKRIQPTEQTTKLAENLINYVLKPSKSLREFGKSPARAVVKEGLWGRNVADLDNKTQIKLNELNTYKDRLKFEAKNMGVTVDLAKNKVFQPLSNLLTELQKAPESNATSINNITKNLNDLLAPQGKFRQLNSVSIDEAYNIRDIVNNLKPTGIFNTQSEAMTSKALHQVYHNIAEAINISGISPNLKLTNRRISDLISLKEAINDASNRNPSYWRMLPFPLMVGYALKGPLGVASGLATLAAETTAGATTISKIMGKKYPKVK